MCGSMFGGGSASGDGCFKFIGVAQGATKGKESSKEQSEESSKGWNGRELCNARHGAV